MTHKVSEGQDIIDISIQNFGSIEEGLFKLINDNNLTVNDSLTSGQELTINQVDNGNKQVISYFSNRDFVINNADEVQLSTLLGAFNNDFNNDFDNTTL